jgi:hypothetical protein
MDIDAIHTDLMWVAEYWPGLVDSRIPGTRRAWRRLVLSADQRFERDLQARAERAESTGAMPGAHAAPVDIAVLDLMSEILVEAEDIAWTVAESGGADETWPGSPSTAFADARPYLAYAARHLAAADEARPGVAAWAGPIAARMVRQTARTLCMVYDGQQLDVECPWCRGVTAETPAGGAQTWRVRELPGEQIAIVCEGACEPPMRDVGTWWAGQPCWPLTDWPWLVQRLSEGEQAPPRVRPRAEYGVLSGRA